MNWRSSIAPIARVTASTSALTKLSVTCAPDFSAGLCPAARLAAVCAVRGGVTRLAEIAVAIRRSMIKLGCFFMLIRSR